MNALWAPACEVKQLHCRAQMLATIRAFFAAKKVLEVETPLLCQATTTDPQLDFFASVYRAFPKQQQAAGKPMYLQPSPEFAMKRLLAAGSGSIFQICKAFRNGEYGRLHNPEFSVLEWYRVDYSLQQLMDEVEALLTTVLADLEPIENAPRFSYPRLFKELTGLNALTFCPASYLAYAKNNQLPDAANLCQHDHALWLDLIFSHKIQPELRNYPLCMVQDYPAIQASLARINTDNPAVADRFEVFIKGVEIANGFLELADRAEQTRRFDQENQTRKQAGLTTIAKDYYFLDALAAGLPNCSGIALGLDRLLMILTNTSALHEVLAFPFDRA